jgi:hypothetical protein
MEEMLDDDTLDITPPRETWRSWAEAGDVEQLLGLLRSKPLGFYDVPHLLRLLMRACQVRARSDPRGFAEFLFSEMAAINGLLLLRAQLQIGARIAATGEGTGRAGIAELSQDLTERLLPRLAELQRGVGEVLATQAATARMWALAEARRAANGRETGAGPTAPLRSRTSDSPEAGRKRRRASNGKDKATTNGRVTGATNGKAAGATNGKAVGATNGEGAGRGGRRRHG